ncbi:MAG TPA: rhamnulokinase family protein [Phycisphaerae bacterium]|nr:rhamnulokinase family protein [Phycisphaerae bacterium]
MPTDKHYLAIDLGAESGRVMLGTLSDGGREGAGIKLTEIHRFPNIPVQLGNSLHWDILRLWHEIKTGINKAAASHDIAGIAVDTWGVDFGLLDSTGQLLGNPVCYRDPRTEKMPEALFSRLSQQKIYSITGIQTMSLNTLFQLAALSFNNSPQLHAAKNILFLPDLITYFLTGTMGTDYTIASTSQMLDARTRQWSPDVLNAIGISASLFAPISIPGEKNSIRGTVLPAVNEKLAAANTPVIAVGGHDTASAVAAVPADSSKGDWLYLSSGTWSLLGAEIDEPVLTEKAAQYNITNEGGIGGGGGKIRLLKNLAGLWLLQECRREWAREAGGETEYDYATLTQMAESAEPHIALLDVQDPAFSTPGNMPGKIIAHCTRTHQRVPQTHGEFARVILESLAASYAKVVQMLEEITGKRFKTLHIVGGGSQNNLLNQLAADATNLPVLAGPVEATALGNIITQAITTGALPDIAAGRALVAKSLAARPFEPGAKR